MPAKCPNKSHPLWKVLVGRYGEDLTLYAYDQNGEDIPSLAQAAAIINSFINQNTPANEREDVVTARRKIAQFTKFVPYADIKVVEDNQIPVRARWDRLTHTITINPDILTKDTIGHETFHILYDILQDTNPKLLELGLNHLLNTNSTAIEWVNKKYPEVDEDTRKNEILAYAVGKDTATIFDKMDDATKFERWLMRAFAYIKNLLGIHKDAVRQMAEMIAYSTKPMTVENNLTPKEGTLDLKAPVDNIYDEIKNLNKNEVTRIEQLKQRIIAILERRKIIAERTGKSREQIERIETIHHKMMTSGNILRSIRWFVENAKDDIVSEHNTFINLLKQEANGDKDVFTAQRLAKMRQTVNGYRVLDDIVTLLQEMKDNTSHPEYSNFHALATNRKIRKKNEKGEIETSLVPNRSNWISQLNYLVGLRNTLSNQYVVKGIKNVADFLAPFHGHMIIRFKEQAERNWNHLHKEGKTDLTLEQYLDNELKIHKTELDEATRINIERELYKASKDINTLQRWLDTVYDSPDAVVSSLVKAFETAHDKSHVRSHEIYVQMVDAVRDLEKFFGAAKVMGMDPRVMYDFMLEKDDAGNPTGYIVRELKSSFWDAFNQAKNEAREKAENKIDFKTQKRQSPEQVARDVESAVRKFWSENAPITPKDSKKMSKDLLAHMKSLYEQKKITSKDYEFFLNEYDIRTADFPGEIYDLFDAMKTPFREYGAINKETGERNLTEEAVEAYTEWKRENIAKYRTVNRKWINEAYNNLPQDKNDPRRKFYDLIVSTADDVEAGLPYKHRLYGRLPGIEKTPSERLAAGQGMKKAARAKIQETFQVRPDETERGDSKTRLELINEDNEPIHYIPVYFTNILPAVDQSYDLATIFYDYFRMAVDFKEKLEILPQAEMVRYLINNRQYIKRDDNGNPVLDALSVETFRKNPDIKGKPRESTANEKTTKMAEQFNDWFEAVFYGIHQVDEGSIKIPFTGMQIDFAKAMNLINSYTSIGMLGLNFIAGTANIMLGNAMDAIEAFAGENYNLKDFAKSGVLYAKNFPGILGDIGTRKMMNLVNVLNERFETLNEYENGQFRENSVFKRMMHSDALFFYMNAGEHEIQSRVMLSMLEHLRAKNTKREDIGSMLSHLKVKNGIMSVDKDVANFGDKDQVKFKMTMKRILSGMHGEYYRNAQPAWQRYSMFRMAMMFRKFLVPGFKRRWGGREINDVLGKPVEGYYRSFGRYAANLFTSIKALGVSGASESWTDLTSSEKANIKRACADLAFLAAAIVLATVFTKIKGQDDGEDDPWIVNFLAYQALRMRSEMAFYLLPTAAMQILRSPAAAVSMTETLIDFFGDLTYPVFSGTFEFARYKQGNRKDQLKIMKPAIDLIPGYKQYFRLKYIDDQLTWFNR